MRLDLRDEYFQNKVNCGWNLKWMNLNEILFIFGFYEEVKELMLV